MDSASIKPVSTIVSKLLNKFSVTRVATSPGSTADIQELLWLIADSGARSQIGYLITLFRSDLKGLDVHSRNNVYATVVRTLETFSEDPEFPTIPPSASYKLFEKASREDYAARWLKWFADHH